MNDIDDPLPRTLLALADRAAGHLASPPDGPDDVALAQRAARLGRRRLRTRTTLRATGTLVAATALTVAGVHLFPYQLQRLPVVGGLVPVPTASPDLVKTSTYDPYAHFMDEPARGSLAGDKALADKAFAAWATAKTVSVNRGRGIFDDLRGAPHLVWAGDTPTGPAAVVAQDAFLHPHEDMSPEHTGPQTLLGYLTTGPDGALHLTYDDYGPDNGQSSAGHGKVSGLVGVWLDDARRRLLVVDPGYPLAVSTRWAYHPDGSVTRDWKPVAFQDGAATVDLSAGTDPDLVRVARTPVTDVWDVQQIGPDGSAGATTVTVSEGERVPWASSRVCVAVPAGALDDQTCIGWGETALSTARDAVTAPGVVGEMMPMGEVVGRTKDGRTFAVGTFALDSDPTRVVAGVFSGTDPRTAHADDLVDAGVLDPKAALPIAVRLPDAQGWVVANVGASLRFRTGPSGGWQDAGKDAALLPDAATLEVEVTPAGGAPTVVTLGG